jgi:hypothetical protein
MSSTAHPLCKVCKKAHGHREPHVWGAESNSETNVSNVETRSPGALVSRSNGPVAVLEAEILRGREIIEVDIAKLKVQVAELQQRLAGIDTTTELVSKGFDKTAYQREYMRAKRAKQ